MEEDNKSFRPSVFSGKQEDYIMWAAKFMSYGQVKGFKTILTGTQKAPNYDKELDPTTDSTLLRLRKANDLAYSMLNMSVKDPVSFGAIFNASTKELPDGDARQAWLNIMSIFKPVSNAKKHELEQKFNQCSLTKEAFNPDEWFAELEQIRLQLLLDFKVTYDDDKIISQVVYNLTPALYQTTVALFKRDLNRGLPLSLMEVKNDIRQVYASAQMTTKRNKNGERILVTGRFRKFKGDCKLCGKKGHKAIDCWDNPKNIAKRPKNYNSKKGNESATTAKSQTNKPIHCDYCNKDYHTIDKCFKKQKDDKNKESKTSTPPVRSEKAEVQLICLSRTEKEMLMLHSNSTTPFTDNTFIADSGATSHMRYSTEGMYNLQPYSTQITVGNNEIMMSQSIGDFKGTLFQQDGTYMTIILKDVLYVPDLWVNLLSLTNAIQQPYVHLQSSNECISLKIGTNQIILFDKIIKGGSGQLLGVEIIPQNEHACITRDMCISYESFHEKLGHPNENITKRTALHMGIKLKEAADSKCHSCIIGKSRRKNIPKINDSKATEKGERISIDISSINHISFGGAKYWLMIQDEYTGYIWSMFLKSKDELPDIVIDWIKQIMKEHNIVIKKIRCDNAGENKILQQIIQEDEKLNIKFEFTAPYTPEQNGKVERQFATLYGKVRAMLNWAKVPKTLRAKLWAQCAETATKLENIISKHEDHQSSSELFYGNNPDWSKNLRTFGEIGIIYDTNKIKSKLKDRGNPAMFIGYSNDHTSNVYKFLAENNYMIMSRNVTWVNKSYGDYHNLEANAIQINEMIDTNDMMDDESDESIKSDEDLPDDPMSEDEENELIERIPTKRTSGLSRELRNMRTYFNPNPEETVENAMITRVFNKEASMIATINDGNPDPKTYKEAKVCKHWEDWWKAMCVEFNNMEQKQVWKICNKRDVPTGRKIIGNRWVYVQKDDGRYRARTVAKGFSQIPGKDFQENHAPVVNDTTFHLVLALKVLFKLEAGQFDIETAFLYGDLEEELWMVLPEGYVEYYKDKYGIEINPEIHCVKLLKAIYGLVQAARQWWKKFKEVMETMNYIPSPADPCLFIRDNQDKSQSAFVIIYVDDGGIFSTKENIQQIIQTLNKDFKVKYLGKLEHFVGCHIIENEEKDTIWIHQPKLLKHLKQDFGDIIKTTKEYQTPAGPKTTCIRPEKGDPLITKENQSIFRSGVGMLLYLVKHSRPDIANAVRELSKVADGATEAHWKAMCRLIKYVLDTANYGLKIKPKDNKNNLFYLEGIADSEYAGDKDSRISVYGYIIYFCGAPIAWKSKSGKSVTLSSTEAEYFAMSEVAKELIFAKQLLQSMDIMIEFPVIIRVDNVGAIYIANNYTIGQRTKHIDIRTHFVRNFIEDGILKVIFIKSEDNDADIFTKNTSEEIFKKHQKKNVEQIENSINE